MNVEMEMRLCQCGRNYKVMVGSPQTMCSIQCIGYGIKARGDHQRLSRESEPTTETVHVDVTKTLSSKENVLSNRKHSIHLIPRSGSSWGMSGMKGVARNKTPPEQPEPRKIESEKMKTAEDVTTKTESLMPQKKKSVPVVMPETPQELSEESRRGLQMEATSSNCCVTKTEMEKSSENIQKVDVHRIQVAVQVANALAVTVQTQVNTVKIMGDFMRSK